MARVLLIDDDPVICELLRDILVTAQHEVTVARDGYEGILLFDENPVDIVITDIFMPEMEGLETITALRAKSSAIKVIAISGGTPLRDVDVLEWAKGHGADFAFYKPVAERDLLEAVEACITAA